MCKCDIDFNKGDYKIYWKARNKGIEAEWRNCIREQIQETNKERHQEVSSYSGERFIENNICIAKGYINVPIVGNI